MPSFVIKEQELIVKPDQQTAKLNAISVSAWEHCPDWILL